MAANQKREFKRSEVGQYLDDTSIILQKWVATEGKSMRAHHYHEHYEMYYLLSGDRYYFIKDQTYHLKKGSFVLIKPYDIHSTSNASSKGYERYLISFHKNFLNDFLKGTDCEILLSSFVSGGRVVNFEGKDQETAEALLTMMLAEFERKQTGYLQFLKAGLMQLLLMAMRRSENTDVAPSVTDYFNPTHKTVSNVAAYINNNYSEDITLNSISNRFFISPCYFSRIFKEATGFSFVEYLNGVRLKEAQRLLAKTDMSVSDIGERVGYKSNTHFGRVFKSAFGISPSLYRKKVRSNIYGLNEEKGK